MLPPAGTLVSEVSISVALEYERENASWVVRGWRRHVFQYLRLRCLHSGENADAQKHGVCASHAEAGWKRVRQAVA
jgi:hypothetical protein